MTRNPFRKGSRAYRAMDALVQGPRTLDQLASLRVGKTPRAVVYVLKTMLSELAGVKVTVGGTHDPKRAWAVVDRIQGSAEVNLEVSADSPLAGMSQPEGSVVKQQSLPDRRDWPEEVSVKADKFGYVPPAEFGRILDSAKAGDNLFLVGPTGCGKTSLAKRLGRDLKAEVIRQNFNGETTTDNLIGYTKVVAQNGVPVTEWHDGELTRAARTAAQGKKVIYMADEADSGIPEVLFQFHRVMEIDEQNNRTIEVNGETLVIQHGMLTIIACANTFGRGDDSGAYQGTNVLNLAFLNRFHTVFFLDYPSNELEILKAQGCPHETAQRLVVIARAVRQLAKSERLAGLVFSTRDLKSVSSKVALWGLKEALRYGWLNKLTRDEQGYVSRMPEFRNVSC